jgi:hypothetical protein
LISNLNNSSNSFESSVIPSSSLIHIYISHQRQANFLADWMHSVPKVHIKTLTAWSLVAVTLTAAVDASYLFI